jgi:hypothetical protein
MFEKIVLAAVVILPIYLIVKAWRWSTSISKATERTPWSVRTVEAAVLAILAIVMVAHVASGGIGITTTHIQDFVVRERAFICWIMIAVAVCLVLLGLWKSISLAAGGMIVSAWIAMAMIRSALSYEHFEKEILQIPVPVEITIREQIDDIDVVINGVRMGKAPLHTTIEELESKFPPTITNSLDESLKAGMDEVLKESRDWRNIGNMACLPGRFVHLGRATRFPETKMSLYFELERHGQPVMIHRENYFHSDPSRKFDNIQPGKILLSVMTEEWHRDTATILDKARLMDYKIDADWISAADTYFHLVRNAMIAVIPEEPEFQQVLTDWAKFRYHLDQATDAKSAWQALEAIQAQVDKEGSYHTKSIAGDAVEYLIERLDSDQVIRLAKSKLKSRSTIGFNGFVNRWPVEKGKTFFWVSFQTPLEPGEPHIKLSSDSPQANLKTSDFVLAHVIWQLDQKWNNQSRNGDNRIEREIVPELVRISHHDKTARELATIVGGSVLDEFSRRQQQHVHSFEKSDDPSKNISIGEQLISRDF